MNWNWSCIWELLTWVVDFSKGKLISPLDSSIFGDNIWCFLHLRTHQEHFWFDWIWAKTGFRKSCKIQENLVCEWTGTGALQIGLVQSCFTLRCQILARSEKFWKSKVFHNFYKVSLVFVTSLIILHWKTLFCQISFPWKFQKCVWIHSLNCPKICVLFIKTKIASNRDYISEANLEL